MHKKEEAHEEHNDSQATIDALAKRLMNVREDLEVDKYFRALVKLEGSDLHMKVDSPPMVRTKGELRPLNRGPVDAEEMVKLLMPMMTMNMFYALINYNPRQIWLHAMLMTAG